MRTPSQAFLDKLALGKLALCEIYEIGLTMGKTYYFTTLDKGIIFGDKTYEPLPITRDPISAKIDLSADSVKISISNITQELALEVENNVLEGAKVTIKRVFYDEAAGAGDCITLFEGYASSEYDRKVLVLNCTSFLNSLNVQVPRNLYQEACNFQLFDGNCGLNRTTYRENGTVTEEASNNFDIIGNHPHQAEAGYYNLGEIEVLSGKNIGVRKMIRYCSVNTLTVAVPFRYPMKVNDTYYCWCGCGKTPETCHTKFNNKNNFFGFVWIPSAQETLWSLFFILGYSLLKIISQPFL